MLLLLIIISVAVYIVFPGKISNNGGGNEEGGKDKDKDKTFLLAISIVVEIPGTDEGQPKTTRLLLEEELPTIKLFGDNYNQLTKDNCLMKKVNFVKSFIPSEPGKYVIDFNLTKVPVIFAGMFERYDQLNYIDLS